MKLLHRYEAKIISGCQHRGDDKPVPVMTSIYREYLDAAYQQMIIEMLEFGRFDQFIGNMIRAVAVHGKYDLTKNRTVFV